MRKAILFIGALLISATIFSQAPAKFSYQAVIRNAEGKVVDNSAVTLKVSILQSSIEGSVVFSEIHTPTTNANGLLNIEVGDGTPVEGNLIDIVWSEGPYFIKTEVDPEGGTDYTITSTSQLLSVPYALHAGIAEGIEGTGDPIKNIGDPIDAQDAATKAYVDARIAQIYHALGGDTLNVLYTSDSTGVLMDIDGNIYNIKKFGTQWWMTQNLKVKHYNDGEAIPIITDATEWYDTGSGGYCWYDNDQAGYEIPYGALYNWYVVGTDKICPIGWHAPSLEEGLALIDYAGGGELAGGPLKEASTDHWLDPNVGATNAMGFTAVGAGYRNYLGEFNNMKKTLTLWTISVPGSGWGSTIGFSARSTKGWNTQGNQHDGYSIRCVRDE